MRWIIIAAILALFLSSLEYADAANLTWTDNANNEVGFMVQRRLTQYQPGTRTVVNPGTFGPLFQIVGADVQSYSDFTAVADINYDNEYCYRVTAYNLDNAGVIQESPPSNAACLVIPRPAPPVVVPAAPSNANVTP